MFCVLSDICYFVHLLCILYYLNIIYYAAQCSEINSISITMLDLVLASISFSVSYTAPGVQLPVEGTGLSPCHQALLPQHQVQAGQQQCHLTSTCRETLLSHLHEAAAGGLSPHQALLQLTGKGPICSNGRLARTSA